MSAQRWRKLCESKNFGIHIKTEQKYKQVTTHKDIKEDHQIFIQTARITPMTESREHHRLLAAILIPNLRLVQGRFSRAALFRQRATRRAKKFTNRG